MATGKRKKSSEKVEQEETEKTENKKYLCSLCFLLFCFPVLLIRHSAKELRNEDSSFGFCALKRSLLPVSGSLHIR